MIEKMTSEERSGNFGGHGQARYMRLMITYPHRVEVQDMHVNADGEWWDERREWILMNHPGVRWDFIHAAFMSGGITRRVIIFGFADSKAAVHFALRWKGEA